MRRSMKERDEQIEVLIERLESAMEELMTQNRKEMATKVNEVVAGKLEVERELKECKSKFADLTNAVLLKPAAERGDTIGTRGCREDSCGTEQEGNGDRGE